MSNINWVKYNPNPSGRHNAADCIIRALCKAFNKSWLEVYNELCEIGRRNLFMPFSKWGHDYYLRNYQTINVYKMVGTQRKRLTINDITKFEGVYIVQIANHLVTISDNKFWDLWDCGDKCAYKIWKVEK